MIAVGKKTSTITKKSNSEEKKAMAQVDISLWRTEVQLPFFYDFESPKKQVYHIDAYICRIGP